MSQYERNCPAGMVCCQNLNRCDALGCSTDFDPPTPPVAFHQSLPSCAFVSDNQMICTSSDSFNFCNGQQMVRGPDQFCPQGTICCPALRRCDLIENCPSYTTLTTTTYSGQSSKSIATNILSPTTTKTKSNLETPAHIHVSNYSTCLGVKDGNIVCTSPTSFNICLGECKLILSILFYLINYFTNIIF